MLHITNRVMGAEICSEFLGEPQVIVHPQQAELRISQQELGLEPIKCHALEVGLGVDDLCTVIVEGPRAVLEVQLALHEEHTEFLRVGTIKLVRFTDLHPTLRFGGLAGGGGGMSKGGDCSRELQQDSVCWVVLIIVIVAIMVGSTIQRTTRGATRGTSRGASRGAGRGGGGPLAM